MSNEIESSADKMARLKKEAETGVQDKICPFMSSSAGYVSCTPQCKLYKMGHKRFECMIQELASISWNTKKRY